MPRLDQSIISKYRIINDEDVNMFLRAFDEPEGLKVLEVGSHDEPVANILSDHGYSVFGVDLREYDPAQDLKKDEYRPKCNYTYTRSDFCDLPPQFLKEHLGSFDIAASISAIEHFGLGTYNEGVTHPYYDVIAARTIWSLLKDGGVCYLTVPFGGNHSDVIPHWRVYDLKSLRERLTQDFLVEYAFPFVAGPFQLEGRHYYVGDAITPDQAMRFSGDPPHISIIVKMRKIPVKRLSPDGR